MYNEKALEEAFALAIKHQQAIEAVERAAATIFDQELMVEAGLKELMRFYASMERSAEEMRRQIEIAAKIPRPRSAP